MTGRQALRMPAQDDKDDKRFVEVLAVETVEMVETAVENGRDSTVG